MSRLLLSLVLIGLALLLVACSDSAPPPPPAPNAALEKARAVEGQVMEGKARIDEELDQQD